MKKEIELASPHMSEEGYEMRFIKEAFDTNWIAPLGKNVDQFELEFAKKINSKYATALISGTAAIHLALRAVGVEKDDLVFCQSLTFSATANPIIYQNGKPIFLDSDYKSWNMDPNVLEDAFKKYKRPKAVIVVHLYGLSAQLDEIKQLCDKYEVPLIEDAAESLGSYYKGKQTGTIGDFGIFSFNGNKIITTSGGGMLVSNNEEPIKKAHFWATQSREPTLHYQHSELGYNYRMSNVLAGIGRGQLMVLDQRIAQKKYIFNYYKQELNNFNFMPINDYDNPNCWLSCITDVENPMKIIDALEKENIKARPIWKPMHLQPFFSEFDYIGSNVSETLFNKGVCLPSDTKMSDEDLDRVCKVIKRIYE
jgi:dTDP-4-amino-4,6-dideoxygalactose transaminase